MKHDKQKHWTVLAKEWLDKHQTPWGDQPAYVVSEAVTMLRAALEERKELEYRLEFGDYNE